MGKFKSPIKTLKWRTRDAGALLLVLCVIPTCSRGQAGVETAGADSASAGAATAATKVIPVPSPRPGTNNKSPYIPTREGPPQDEMNRKALEQRAGKDAAKLLLQSVPSDSAIYIDGMFVGRTPLLLIVPPEKYKVEMRGKREEFGEYLIELSPNEAQRLTLTLALRYPTSITVQTGRAAPVSRVTVAGAQVLPVSSLPQPGEESKSASLPVREEPSADETNRKALEQRAGKDAAKLLLQSVPSEAMAYIDGTFIGRTPLQLIVPPGKYKVEMRGKLEEFGESLVGLLPNETQKLTLELALRYPAKIVAR
jgi:hypothetical protein